MKWTILSLIIFFGCTGKSPQPAEGNIPALNILSTDPLLHFKNGIWFYNDTLFSGTITEKYSDSIIHQVTSYLNGKAEGWQQTFFSDGRISDKRYYHNGEKDSVHTGWWPNGKKRFEYHFSNGLYDGDYKEWYESGEALKHIHYINGVDDWAKGWRQNGKLYMNFVMKDGRRYGLNNSNLCYTVKNGKGEFIASVKDSSK